MGNIYFASDFHLGVDGPTSSQEREKTIVRWLQSIEQDAEALYIVGDIFDYWFEYKQVVPRGFTRLLGQLARMRDAGVPIYFFSGNHDVWMFDYFQEEMGIPVNHAPIDVQLGHHRFFIGHGDGLGPDDLGYKRMKKIFRNPICQWLFARLHPNFAIKIMRLSSQKSRIAAGDESTFLGPHKEWLLQYSERKVQTLPADYFIFGHRHLPIDYMLKNEKSRYINLGDWVRYQSYAVYDGEDVQLRFFENPNGYVVGPSTPFAD